MQSKQLAGSRLQQSTQMFLDIAEIKNDTIILKDGTLRAVMMVSSINFALKSEEEQEAIVSGYVTFLNYLDFPIQIVIQSRRLDIDNYIKRLNEAERDLTNDLLKAQILDYKNYIRELIELGDIMTKNFFIVVPFSPLEARSSGFWGRLASVFSPSKVIQLKEDKFNKFLHELDQRVEHVRMNISSLGLKTVRLDTQSLIELFYNVYNPIVSQTQKLANLQNLRIEE